MKKNKTTLLRLSVVILAIAILYAGIDLFWPFKSDLRQFDPITMGKLETAMWRSYYSRQPVKLFFELAEVLRTQYQFPLLRSYLGAYYAARAAFIFKDGKQRSDYERALPDLESYHSMIHKIGNIDFDVRKASQLELEWWIVHRQRETQPEGALGLACAEAAAEIYQVSVDSTMEHGNLRAAGMVIRDNGAANGGVSEEVWGEIEKLLLACYQSLRRVVSHSWSARKKKRKLFSGLCYW